MVTRTHSALGERHSSCTLERTSRSLSRCFASWKKLGREPSTSEHQKIFAEEMCIETRDMIDAMAAIYTFFVTYTGGSVNTRVRRLQAAEVFESYRKIC